MVIVGLGLISYYYKKIAKSLLNLIWALVFPCSLVKPGGQIFQTNRPYQSNKDRQWQ